MINPVDIINEFYKPGSKIHTVLINHSQKVAEKAVNVAEKLSRLNPDLQFIYEGAMLHDIGIFMTNAPSLFCYGEHIYVCHGILGRLLLEKWGLKKHAMVCERHIGVGLSVEDIKKSHLPLPLRDMRPVSLEEKIIAYADKFYSKNSENGDDEKTLDQIKDELGKYGHDKALVFELWFQDFEGNL